MGCINWYGKRGHEVIAIDQTFESLKFLKHRSKEEGLKNIYLVQDDVRETRFKYSRLCNCKWCA